MHEIEREGEIESAGAMRPAGFAPWVISLALHLALVVGAFGVVWSILRPAPPEQARVVVSFDDPAPAPASDEIADELARPFQMPRETLPEPEPPLEITLSDQIARLEMHPSAILGPAPPRAQMREMIKSRQAPRVEFAGLGASSARGVVYVVDASGSMISSFPLVVGELERSLRRLEPSQWFQVIVFGPGQGGFEWARLPEHPARETKLLPATRRNVEGVMTWMNGLLPSGRSNPTEALEMGIGFRPDVIFVLSSSITGLGMWEPDREALLAQIDQLNPVDPRTGRRAVIIKTIQVLEPDPAGILEAIGQAHGGDEGYNFISREELLAR